MDLRQRKTNRSIINAFLLLRRQKPLERITVRELSELAEISKATFYLHYRDIYDLSEQLQNQVIQDILSGIDQPDAILSDQECFTSALCRGFYAQQNLIEILFSGSQFTILPMRVEQELRRYLHEHHSDLPGSFDLALTYQVYGSFCVFQQYHHQWDLEQLIGLMGQMSNAVARQVL